MRICVPRVEQISLHHRCFVWLINAKINYIHIVAKIAEALQHSCQKQTEVLGLKFHLSTQETCFSSYIPVSQGVGIPTLDHLTELL